MTMLDTSDMYGRGENERLVGRALRGRREHAFVATKGGLLRSDDDFDWRGRNGRPEYLRGPATHPSRASASTSSTLLLHRVDPDVPIEESVGALAGLVESGKVRCIGLSEVSVDTLYRAAAVAPIAAVQSEYSLFSRDVEANGVLDAAHELGIAFVAYAPLGRGMLAGAAPFSAGLSEGDVRRRVPRFDPEHREANTSLAAIVGELARARADTRAARPSVDGGAGRKRDRAARLR